MFKIHFSSVQPLHSVNIRACLYTLRMVNGPLFAQVMNSSCPFKMSLLGMFYKHCDKTSSEISVFVITSTFYFAYYFIFFCKEKRRDITIFHYFIKYNGIYRMPDSKINASKNIKYIQRTRMLAFETSLCYHWLITHYR